MTRRLLVGVADPSETTAPRRYLLDLLEGLAPMGVETQVLLLRDGPLRHDLERLADVRVVTPPPPRAPSGLLESAARRVGGDLSDRVHDRRIAADRDWVVAPHCIHVHGPEAAPVLRYARDPDVPVTTYAHPWDFSIAGLSPLDLRRLLDRTDRYLAADDTVADDLRTAGVDPDRIAPAPDPIRFPDPTPGAEERARNRVALGLPADAAVVGVLPVPDWTDAPDLTLGVVWETQRRAGPDAPRVLWYGMPGGHDGWPVAHDAQQCGLTTLHITDRVPGDVHPAEVFDAVVVPNRSSAPAPDDLASTAVHHGTPVIAWDGHPAAEEVARWGGHTFPRGDVDGPAALLATVADPEGRRRAAAAGWAMVTTDVEQVTPLRIPPP